jgi:hypothetical protein
VATTPRSAELGGGASGRSLGSFSSSPPSRNRIWGSPIGSKPGPTSGRGRRAVSSERPPASPSENDAGGDADAPPPPPPPADTPFLEPCFLAARLAGAVVVVVVVVAVAVAAAAGPVGATASGVDDDNDTTDTTTAAAGGEKLATPDAAAAAGAKPLSCTDVDGDGSRWLFMALDRGVEDVLRFV